MRFTLTPGRRPEYTDAGGRVKGDAVEVRSWPHRSPRRWPREVDIDELTCLETHALEARGPGFEVHEGQAANRHVDEGPGLARVGEHQAGEIAAPVLEVDTGGASEQRGVEGPVGSKSRDRVSRDRFGDHAPIEESHELVEARLLHETANRAAEEVLEVHLVLEREARLRAMRAAPRAEARRSDVTLVSSCIACPAIEVGCLGDQQGDRAQVAFGELANAVFPHLAHGELEQVAVPVGVQHRLAMRVDDLPRLALDVRVDQVLEQVAVAVSLGAADEVLELTGEERSAQKLAIWGPRPCKRGGRLLGVASSRGLCQILARAAHPTTAESPRSRCSSRRLCAFRRRDRTRRHRRRSGRRRPGCHSPRVRRGASAAS